MQKIINVAMGILVLAVLPAAAQEAAAPTNVRDFLAQHDTVLPPLKGPDPRTIPALGVFNKPESTFHYMGQAAGLDGWFLVINPPADQPTGQKQVQLLYTSADGQQLILGAVFAPDGTNITERQVIELRQRDPQVNAMFTNTIEAAQQQFAQNSNTQRMLKNLEPTKPGDQLYGDVVQLASITLGGGDDTPPLLMFIDPKCPHCKKAYEALAEDFLDKKQFQLRLIPIGLLGDDSKKIAQHLLGASDPAAAWRQFADKDYDGSVFTGEPSAIGQAQETLNKAIFDRWKLNATPFIIYRAKNGEVKVVNRVPNDFKALVADIAPLPQ